MTPTLKATVAGESLFFSITLETALGGAPFSVARAARLFALEAGGGVLLGLIVGWLLNW